MMKAVCVLRLLNAAAILAVVGAALGRNSGRIYELTGSARCKGHRNIDHAHFAVIHDYSHLNTAQRLGHRLVNGKMEHSTTIAYGGKIGRIMGGRTMAEEMVVNITNTNQFFADCNHPIVLHLKLSDFKEVARTKRRGKSRDTHRLTFNIGTCHLDTGKCDDDGDFPKPPAPAAPAPAAPAATAPAPTAAAAEEAKKEEIGERVYNLTGTILCEGKQTSDRAYVEALKKPGGAKDTDKNTLLYGHHDQLVGGHIGAESLTLVINNKNRDSKACGEEIEIALSLADFKEEVRKNARGKAKSRDAHRLTLNIGTCHTDTGECDGDGDLNHLKATHHKLKP